MASLLTSAPPESFSHKISLLSPMTGKAVQLKHIDDAPLQAGIWGDGIALAIRKTACYTPFDGQVERIDLASQRWILRAKNGLRMMIQIGPIKQSLMGERLQLQIREKAHFTAGQVLVYVDPMWLNTQIGQTYCIVTVLTKKAITSIVPVSEDTQVDAMNELMSLYLNLTK